MQVSLTLNISADLHSLFTWNTKQVIDFLLYKYSHLLLKKGRQRRVEFYDNGDVMHVLIYTIYCSSSSFTVVISCFTFYFVMLTNWKLEVLYRLSFCLLLLCLQVFVFLAAEYETPKNSLNQVRLD